MDINPTTMLVKAEHHNIPASGPGVWDGLVSTLRTSPGNHCLASFRGIDGATRQIENEAAERFAATWNLCQGIQGDVLNDLANSKSALAAAMQTVLSMAQTHLSDVEEAIADGDIADIAEGDRSGLAEKQAAVALLKAVFAPCVLGSTDWDQAAARAVAPRG